MEELEPKTFEGGVEMPNNNMPLAISSVVLGCIGSGCIGLILGGIAIFFSSNVAKHFANNNYIDSQKSANTAKTLAIIALVLGVVGIIVQFYYGDDLQEYMEQIVAENS